MPEPRTKTSLICEAANAQDWRRAISLAAKLPELGEHRTAILEAQGAFAQPDFYRQIGRDIEKLKADGIAAIKARFAKPSSPPHG